MVEPSPPAAAPRPEVAPVEDLVIVGDAPVTSFLRHRRDPVVAVTLLKTLGVASGLLAALLGIGTIVVVSLSGSEGWVLWLGTLGGVLVIFLGAVFALVQVAMAHLVDTADQVLRQLQDLNASGWGHHAGGSSARVPAQADAPGDDQAVLLREIRDAVRLTEAEKRLLTRRRVAAEVQATNDHLQGGDFAAAREAVAGLLERHPGNKTVQALARRVQEAEAAARAGAESDFQDSIRAYLNAGSWEQAAALAEEYVHKFPDDEHARALRDETRRSRDAATAQTRKDLYDRITTLARDHRWGEALDVASELIQEFPDSEEAAKLRPRLGALTQKAHATERARLLKLVQEHTAAAHWTEAYRAARDLVDAHPDSEEAAQVFGDLARLRRLARRT